MPAFLEKLSKQIYASYKDELGDICLVLPNRRASLFIRKHLAGIIEKTTFLPEFYSIEDFIIKCSGLTMADQLGVQFRLFELHKQIAGKSARKIEEFLPYASWMYSDFNEIDMYLVDQRHLFNYLSEIKAMSIWNPDGKPLSDFQKQYLAFFNSLQEYYEGMNKMLDAEKLSYQGMAFRYLAENIEKLSADWPWKKIIFAGFNALTLSEEKIIEYLIEEKKAEIFWDADKYYVDNPDQEAGNFLRKYFKSIKNENINWEEDNFSTNKDIEVIGVPKNTGQVKYAGEILQQLHGEKGSLSNTAVVLSDETLLLPLLNSIPEDSGEFNVTMGLSLKNTPIFTLLDTMLSFQQNAERFSNRKDDKDTVFYAKDLITVLKHPWMQLLEKPKTSESAQGIVDSIKESGKVFISDQDLYHLLSTHYDDEHKAGDFFKPTNNPQELLSSFISLLAALRKKMIDIRKENKAKMGIELEYIFRFNQLLQRLQDLVRKYDAIANIKTFHIIFRQLAGQMRIPFYGEPLQGLQVMGMLETRTLDFDTLIMLSVNEGTLPSGKMSNSFIPFEIKREFNLPTYRQNNAVFAYHFYRLLQRAKKAYLLYNTESDQMGGGEKSQFITQLLHEAPKYNKEIKIKEHLLTLTAQRGARDTTITIEKDASVMQLLKEEATRGFHPSSLNLYINCPLQFYLARLMKISELEEAEETIDSKLLGIVVHQALETLLEGYCNKTIRKEDFKNLAKQARAEIHKQFSLKMSEGDLSHGKNHLIVNVAGSMLQQLFEREADWTRDDKKLVIVSLEEKVSALMPPIEIMPDTAINFRGTIDRVDTLNNVTRIMDYKTGSVDGKSLKFTEWEELISDPAKSKAFQLMLYAWVYQKSSSDGKPLKAGIISLRAPGNGAIPLIGPEGEWIDGMTLKQFEEQLIILMSEILDPDTPFNQTNDEDRCKYCDYKEMCNRNTIKEYYS